jgi:hypothetical protein
MERHGMRSGGLNGDANPGATTMNFLRLFTGNVLEERREARPKRVFLHIPKCGGSSLHKLLASRFPSAKICPIRHNRLDSIKPQTLARYQLYSGHFTWDSVEEFILGPKSIVTILRDPVRRLLSSYYFGRSHTWSFIREHAHFSEPPAAYDLHGMAYRPAKELDLETYLDSQGKYLSGLMVRWIGGGHGTPDEMLARAKLHLSQMDSIGLVEDMESSVEDIFNAWSLPCPNAIPKELDQSQLANMHPWLEWVGVQELTTSISDKLDEICELDCELYEYARQLVAFRRNQKQQQADATQAAA